MAGVDFDSYEGGFAQGARLGRTVNMIGGACSVALIVGLGIWGYKLALRDVTGIPVFRAVEGPLRVAPKDPGGAVTMHQGLSVNAVAAAGTALPLPETLTLAPRGVELDPTDPAGLADLPMEACRRASSISCSACRTRSRNISFRIPSSARSASPARPSSASISPRSPAST